MSQQDDDLRKRAVAARARAQSLIEDIDKRRERGGDLIHPTMMEAAERLGLLEPRVKRKPPLPTEPWGVFERIFVESDHPDVAAILKLAVFTADDAYYAAEADGVTLAEAHAEMVREAILHLLELGLIDIDRERLRAAEGFPTGRSLRR